MDKLTISEIDIFPLTIVRDRYSGAYSGGKFTAWKCEAQNIPQSIYQSDIECFEFWEAYKNGYLLVEGKQSLVGFGDTPNRAQLDLAIKLKLLGKE